MTEIEVPDWVVEQAAMAVERSHHPEWSDEQFSVWWNHDPFFCERRTTWSGYENMTRKEKSLATARHAITAALGAWVVPVGQAGTMPGTVGFTMAAFKTIDVGVAQPLYTLRQEKPDVLP